MFQFLKSNKTFAVVAIITGLVVAGLIGFAAHNYIVVVVAYVLLAVVVDNVVRKSIKR